MEGSSPLTRGKPRKSRPPTRGCRLIPTHAGKTCRKRLHRCRAWAHPHSRGENHLTARCPASGRGSSPLTRGKPLRLVPSWPMRGLIPTHAGKTRFSQLEVNRNSAHPHSRGENWPDAAAAGIVHGSSPLTRGKHPGRPCCRSRDRLIPTHAGKTARGPRNDTACGAHPHSRGENCRLPDARRRVEGSSPLTRGKLLCQALECSAEGLIPTHAGKTLSSPLALPDAEAHPHSRGENSTSSTSSLTLHGSSPLTRGKLDKVRGHQGHGGLIPTHAGKTSPGRRSHHGSRAHPHSRGENWLLVAVCVGVEGSSPLTRGKHVDVRRARARGGLIPTHAGKTTGPWPARPR